MPRSVLAPRQIVEPLWWLALLAAATVFVARDLPPYFTYTPESFGELWEKRGAVIPHVFPAALAFAIGFLQFSQRLRTSQPRVHRALGLAYVALSLIGAPAAIYLGLRSSCVLCRPPLAVLGALWLVTTAIAFAAARLRDFGVHRAFMVRSFALMNVFSLIRLLDRIPVPGIAKTDIRVFWEWTCMALIVIGTEIALTWWPALRRLQRRAPAAVGG